MGSIADPSYVQQIHQLEDRLKIARTSFDERESSLEAAIRSEEEKHQREIERFRKKMEEFDKQRAAIARQHNGGDSAVFSEANGSSSTALDESLRLLAQGESLANASVQNPSSMLVEFDIDVGLPVDGSDEEPSPPPSGTTTVPAPASSGAETVAAPAPVPVDELIPESYLQSAAQPAPVNDTTTTTTTAPTPTPSQPPTGQS